jgi:hypothetical protein
MVLDILSGGDYCLVLGKGCPHSYILKLETNLSLLQINLRVLLNLVIYLLVVQLQQF